jgi:uncharacterized protein YchJ
MCKKRHDGFYKIPQFIKNAVARERVEIEERTASLEVPGINPSSPFLTDDERKEARRCPCGSGLKYKECCAGEKRK